MKELTIGTGPDDWLIELYMKNKKVQDISETYKEDQFIIIDHLYAHLAEESTPLKEYS